MRQWFYSIAMLTVLALSGALPPAGDARGAVFNWVRAAGDPADGTITDANTTDFLFPVPGIGTVQKVEIRFSALHTFTEDLTATLISPQGTSVVLFDRIGGPGSNFKDTFFSDDAPTAIDGASPPFEGRFRLNAGALLSPFNGEDAAGNWTLRVTDAAELDEGSLVAHNQTVDWGQGPEVAAGTQLFITIPEPAAGLLVLALGGLMAGRPRRRA